MNIKYYNDINILVRVRMRGVCVGRDQRSNLIAVVAASSAAPCVRGP